MADARHEIEPYRAINGLNIGFAMLSRRAQRCTTRIEMRADHVGASTRAPLAEQLDRLKTKPKQR